MSARTVLLVEDEATVREFVTTLLERAGYEVLIASRGDEAIDLFEQRSQEIALVLLDVVMPGKPGREVYEAIKARRPDLPVVMCSGYTRESMDPELLPDDAVELLQKPYHPLDLLGRLRELLGDPTAAAQAQ